MSINYTTMLLDRFVIICANVRSCNSNFDSLINLLESRKISFDILMLTETWLTDQSKSLYELDGYKNVSIYRINKRGGGLRVYVKQSLETVTLDSLSGIFETHESLFMKITANKKFSFTAGLVYRPPNNSIPEFNTYMEETLLTHESTLTTKCIIMGDFNIRLNGSDTYILPPSHINFKDIMRNNNFKQYITSPTHCSNTGIPTSLLDLAFCNFTRDCRALTLDNPVSDHIPILLSFPLKLNNPQTKIHFRDFSTNNIDRFVMDKQEIFASYTISVNNDANLSMHNFILWLYGIVNRYFPYKVKQLSSKRATSPWLDNKALHYINKKHKLYQLLKQGRVSHRLFKAYCILLKHYLILKKNNYFNCKFNSFQKNSKKLWKTINNIIGRNNKSSCINSIFKEDGAIVTDANEIASEFNKFFQSIPAYTQNKLDPPLRDYNNLVNFNQRSIFLFQVSCNEIISLIDGLDSSKTSANLPVKFLKLTKNEIAPILRTLFNKSIEEGLYPNILKIAKVVPIFKAGDSRQLNNYRPISLLPLINKIFEKILNVRIRSFLTDCQVLSENQFGFRKQKDTQQATLQLLNYVIPVLGSDEIAACIFLDFSKAFDTVNHKILLSKLYRYGIRGQPLNLLSSYLENRKQYVCVGNCESQQLSCNIGVPQGSVLGPLLYIIYANDLNYLIYNLKMILFADDTAAVLKSSSRDVLMTYVNYVLDKIQDWCNFNKLSLNKTKTKIMYITNKIVDFLKIYLNDTEIEAVKSFKYLGFIIDDKLSHKYHIESVISKLRRYRYIKYKIALR